MIRPILNIPVTPSGTPESASCKVKQYVISLAGANANLRVDDVFQLVQAVTVAGLTGAVVPYLRFGATWEPLIPVALGEVRDGLAIEGGIYLTNGAGGGTLTLEVHGR